MKRTVPTEPEDRAIAPKLPTTSPLSQPVPECTWGARTSPLPHYSYSTTLPRPLFSVSTVYMFPTPSTDTSGAPSHRGHMSRLMRAAVPRRVFKWLYSFSLAIFVVLTTVFSITSPADIAVQTWLSRLLGIKLLVIFAACALMLLLLLFLYFTRLYKYRVAINHIPARSAYVPLARGDMGREVLAHVERGLQWCVGDVGRRAGPLSNRAAGLRYPGMAPPDYIQHRNVAMGHPHVGTFFPPNCVYEDIVDSFGLRIRCEGLMLTTARIPGYYTMRETLLAEAADDRARALALVVVRHYEALKYGPHLIQEQDLVALLVALDRLLLHVIGNHPIDPLLDAAAAPPPLLHPLLLYLPFRRLRLVALGHRAPSPAPSGHTHSGDSSHASVGHASVAPYEPPTVPRPGPRLARTDTRSSAMSRSTTGSVIKARLAMSTASRTSTRALYPD